MSTLNSSSTRAAVLAAYADNASYQEDDSLTKARAFITACRLLLSPQHSAKRTKGANSAEVELDLGLIRKELEDAQQYATARATDASGAAVQHISFAGFRD